jgi:RimJ/RimL family protein N-acetyltransferase
MKITLRPVFESDGPFLLGLYASTRAAEMALVPWLEAQKTAFLQMQFTAQKTFYGEQFPNARHEVICCDDEPVGRLYLDRSRDSFHILDITITDQRRNKGIGSVVLKEILQGANLAEKPTTIYTENNNPSVRLFERLGFRVSSVRDYQVLLERQPGPLE